MPARTMTSEEIAGLRPDVPPAPGESVLARARRAMQASDCWCPNQQMGSRWPIGCVALEITQRCNLDCTLCYLSEHSEAVKDIPLDEVYRRIDLIFEYYGVHTDVQVTGGEPTLRKREELLSIVRRIRERGMRPTLMTNGARATRSLLEALAQAGLVDVAFHVDTTQRLKGYRNEIELNALRLDCIERAAGLPLSVMFNTSVHDGNFHEIPDLVRFFRSQAGRVRTAAFQVQAQVGRGVHEKRTCITLDSVAAQVEKGAGTAINFTASRVGHPQCNRYGLCLETAGSLHDAFDDPEFVGLLQPATAHLALPRNDPRKAARDYLHWLLRNPAYWRPVLCWAAKKVSRMKSDLLRSRGRIHILSFLVHGFMDADALIPERIGACAFKVMTADGPISMCMHNAKRDVFILQPIALPTATGKTLWQPLRGKPATESSASAPNPAAHGLKRAKGHTRQALLQQRSGGPG